MPAAGLALRVDERGRLMGECWVPTPGLTREEPLFYLRSAAACDCSRLTSRSERSVVNALQPTAAHHLERVGLVPAARAERSIGWISSCTASYSSVRRTVFRSVNSTTWPSNATPL